MDIDIDASGDFFCWVPDAAARLKGRSPVEDDGLKVSLKGISPCPIAMIYAPGMRLRVGFGIVRSYHARNEDSPGWARSRSR
jgi:hypothetical protein